MMLGNSARICEVAPKEVDGVRVYGLQNPENRNIVKFFPESVLNPSSYEVDDLVFLSVDQTYTPRTIFENHGLVYDEIMENMFGKTHRVRKVTHHSPGIDFISLKGPDGKVLDFPELLICPAMLQDDILSRKSCEQESDRTSTRGDDMDIIIGHSP